MQLFSCKGKGKLNHCAANHQRICWVDIRVSLPSAPTWGTKTGSMIITKLAASFPMPPYWFFGPKCSVGRVLVKDPAISSHTWSTVNWTTFYPNWRSGWCFNCVLCTVLFTKQPVRQMDILYFSVAQGGILGAIFNFGRLFWGDIEKNFALLCLVLVVVLFMQWLLPFFFSLLGQW